MLTARQSARTESLRHLGTIDSLPPGLPTSEVYALLKALDVVVVPIIHGRPSRGDQVINPVAAWILSIYRDCFFVKFFCISTEARAELDTRNMLFLRLAPMIKDWVANLSCPVEFASILGASGVLKYPLAD
jgi:hypothetical protein